MTTWRKWFHDAEADWATLQIVYQATIDYDAPGRAFGDGLSAAVQILHDHEVLDQEFDDGFGGPEAPRIVAMDANFIYFPCQYDGATGVTKIRRDVRGYIGSTEPTPYPGG